MGGHAHYCWKGADIVGNGRLRATADTVRSLLCNCVFVSAFFAVAGADLLEMSFLACGV